VPLCIAARIIAEGRALPQIADTGIYQPAAAWYFSSFVGSFFARPGKKNLPR
jgi:hypothetical protein